MSEHQTELFRFNHDICSNRHGGNEFSTAANPNPHQKSRDRLRIVLHIRDNGPRTGEEIGKELGMCYSTVSARMSELKREGAIIKVGRRPTTTGATAGVFALQSR